MTCQKASGPGSDADRLRRSLGGLLLAAVAVALALASPARAAPVGVVTEFDLPNPQSALRGITAGPDGNVWFTEGAAHQIGRITPSGVITEFPLAPDAQPSAIVTGPDGNLWFIDGNQIGRMTPTGAVNRFSEGIIPNAGLSDIAVGPDGALWFTESFKDQIGRITAAGVVQEFGGILEGSAPSSIVTGPDGNLWFSELGSDRVRNIARNGMFSDVEAVLGASSGPTGIAAGPDGNLWVAQPGRTLDSVAAQGVARITPSGGVTEFKTGITRDSLPQDIASGPDGNLWFTEFDGNRIGRITPSGDVIEFSSGLTQNSGPQGITVGADKNLWFIEFTGNRIGRITSGIDPPHPQVSGVTPPPTAAATLQIRSAELTASWAASRVRRGRLTVTLAAPRAARVAIALTRTRRGKVVVVRNWTSRLTSAGTATRRLAFRGKVLPGAYTVRAREVGRNDVATRSATLKPPPEGVVERAFITTSVGGRATARIGAGRFFQIFGNFHFAARPAKGQALSATWALGAFRKRVALARPSGPLLLTTIGSTRSGILQSGRWTVTLRAGRSTIARASIRIG